MKSFFSEQNELKNKIFVSILESVVDGLVIANAEGQFQFFNHSAEEILGIGLTASNPDHWSETYGLFLTDQKTPYPPEDLPLSKALRGETVKGVEVFVKNHQRPQGVWLSVAAQPILNEVQERIGAVAIFRDYSFQKRHEEEIYLANQELEKRINERTLQLRETNARLEQEVKEKIRTQQDLIQEKEKLRSRIEQMTQFQEALLQITKFENEKLEDALHLITQISSQMLHCEQVGIWWFDENRSSITCATVYKKTSQSFEKGACLKSEDYPNYFHALEENRTLAAHDARKDPRTSEFTQNYLIPQQITSMMDVPIRLHGKVIGIICHEHIGEPREWTLEEQDFAASVADLTSLALESSERKKAEAETRKKSEELMRSNQELEQFAYVASHDLQEPLHKIIAFGDRLKNYPGKTLDDKGSDYLQRMQRASMNMKSLIEDLLQFARITTRAKAFEWIDLNKMIQVILNDFEIKLVELKAKVQIEKLPLICGDRSQMRQVFQNLISNGIKFAKANTPPHIHIFSNQSEKEWIEIIIEDEGIGFDPKFSEKIFLPFQRLHSRSEYEGTGMGLAICDKIMKRHQGKIIAQSHLGQGSRMILLLPKHKEVSNEP
ncbi:MAG: GAF domain-containing protein [Deltaproteobacteria bacterium]|nr:GAF domain-containing protein [Deltaproteobacteria bacterium]